MSRSRPYRKNDNAWVEQRHWTHVRKVEQGGGIPPDEYDRGELPIPRELYASLTLHKKGAGSRVANTGRGGAGEAGGLSHLFPIQPTESTPVAARKLASSRSLVGPGPSTRSVCSHAILTLVRKRRQVSLRFPSFSSVPATPRPPHAILLFQSTLERRTSWLK